MPPLRAAVIGAGHLGRYHAQKYAHEPGVQLAAVVDIDDGRARALASRSGATAMNHHHGLAGRVDIASVVVPASRHFDVVRDLLEAGIHVLVEKPLTASVEHGRDLVERAARCGRVLQVGHVERFNPVVRALFERAETPTFIECHRLAMFCERGTDVDVVLDLMIHDIDLMLGLLRSPVAAVEATGRPVRTGRLDVATARIHFANGCIAQLTASRVADCAQRRMRVVQPRGCLAADLGAGTLLELQRQPGRAGARWHASRRQLGPADPLADEIRCFVQAVRSGPTPDDTGADGLRALETASGVVERIRADATLQ